MAREFDRRTFSAARLTPERAATLRTAAEGAQLLAGAPPARLAGFDAITGSPSSLQITDAPAAQGDYVQRALAELQKVGGALGFAPTQPAEYVADPNVQPASSGAVAVHVQQQHQGIPIFQANRVVRFDPAGRPQEIVGQTVAVDAGHAATPSVRVEEAVLKAAAFIATPDPDEAGAKDQFGEPLAPPAVDLSGFSPRVTSVFTNRADRPTVLAAGPFADPIRAGLIWFDLDGDLRLAWEVILTLPDYAGQYRVLVDARDGTLLYCRQLIHHAAARGAVYRVDGGRPRELVDFPLPLAEYPLPPPQDLPADFPYAWVDADTAIGINATAQLAESGKTVAGTPQGGLVLFQPASDQGNAQRLLNAFFLCCYMHDFFYMLGFREQDGNFQRENFGRRGAPSDAVDVRVYDGPISGTANMLTPVDGSRPVLRLGLVTASKHHTALDSSVVFHEYTHGVTNRMVGGPLNVRAMDAIQSQAMGEGTSDYIACSVNESERVGAWVVPGGIRGAPYDRSYPNSFGDLGIGRFAEIHSAGEIWCAALLEVNRTIGKALGLQLLVDALRLMPANPSFLDGRDAILQALAFMGDAGRLGPAQVAVARDGIWRAFARYGMGDGASCIGAATFAGIVADSTPRLSDGGATDAHTLRVERAPGLRIPDAQPAGVTSALAVERAGRIAQIRVDVDIQHPYIGDLEVRLIAPSGQAVTLHRPSDDSASDLVRSFTSADLPALAALAGAAPQGEWRLHVADHYAQDAGVLRRWGLTLALEPAPAPLAAGATGGDPDNFKLISGIGPGIEKRLHSADIRSYAQLAALSPAQLAAIIGKANLTEERIAKSGWIERARELADQEGPAASAFAPETIRLSAADVAEEAPPEGVGRQHYASFMIELLLEADQRVRRTIVKYLRGVHGATEAKWGGWDGPALIDFITRQADLNLTPIVEPEPELGAAPALIEPQLPAYRGAPPPGAASLC